MGQFEVGVRAIILYNRKVLLMRRSNADKIWECPGGKVEFGEGLQDALRREIKEEAGLAIAIESLLYAETIQMKPDLQIVGLMYLCHAEGDDVAISDEHMDFVWADKELLLKLLNQNMRNELIENAVLDSLEID